LKRVKPFLRLCLQNASLDKHCEHIKIVRDAFYFATFDLVDVAGWHVERFARRGNLAWQWPVFNPFLNPPGGGRNPEICR
jgi:hypothetical protein